MKPIIVIIVGVTLLAAVLCTASYKKEDKAVKPVTVECKSDSLQSVIDSLNSEFSIEREGWENKENRYENIIFHYQYGLGYIKDYDPATYKKIIRIAMLREDFSYEVEKDFKEQVRFYR